MTDEATSTTISTEEYNKVLDRARNLEAKLTDTEKKFGWAKDLNPDQVRADKEALELLMKEKGSTDSTKIDELLARKEKELKDRFDSSLTEKEKMVETLSAKVQRLEVVNPAMLKATEYFNSTELELIGMLVERDLGIIEGEIVAKGADGKPIPSKKNPRVNMGLDEYMEALADKYPGAARARTSGGSKEHGTTTGTSSGTSKWDRLTRSELSNLSKAEVDTVPVEILRKLID